VVQCGWTADLSNQPSPAQARSMVYLSLIEGAKGIWWYSMHDPGWDLTKSPLWPQMKAINAEIKVLAEPLMLGRVVADIKSEQPEIFFRAVEYQNKTYLLVTNPQNKSAQVTFSLPKSIRSWRPLGSDAKSSVEHQRMQVSLTGIDSRTFVLEK
jgi:hypothetical protein